MNREEHQQAWKSRVENYRASGHTMAAWSKELLKCLLIRTLDKPFLRIRYGSFHYHVFVKGLH